MAKDTTKLKLTDEALVEMLATLENWEIVNGKLRKEFEFKNFDNAMVFVNKVADIARAMDHHPEMYNVYNRVTLELSTHDAKGLTKLDFLFARKVDMLKLET